MRGRNFIFYTVPAAGLLSMLLLCSCSNSESRNTGGIPEQTEAVSGVLVTSAVSSSLTAPAAEGSYVSDTKEIGDVTSSVSETTVTDISDTVTDTATSSENPGINPDDEVLPVYPSVHDNDNNAVTNNTDKSETVYNTDSTEFSESENELPGINPF